MSKYIDLSDIKDTLTAQAINAGQSFLAGKVTSTFTKVSEDEGVQALTNAATAGIGLYSTISTLTGDTGNGQTGLEVALTGVVSDLTNKITESITKQGTEIALDFVNKHIDAVTGIPKGILEISLAYFNSYKLSITDLIKEFITPQEPEIEKQTKNQEENDQKNFITDIKEKYMKNRSYITGFINDGVSYINLITSYIQQGPDWVESKAEEGIKSVASKIQKAADKQWDNDKKAIDKFIKSRGEQIGQRMVDNYNNILRNQAQKITADKEKEIQKLVTKASTILQKAKLKIMSLTGINLPI